MVQKPSMTAGSGPLRLEVAWDSAEPQGSADRATMGSGYLWLGDKIVWGDPAGNEPVRWSWVDLLEFLTENWVFLDFEEDYPLGLSPANPARLRSEAEAQWRDGRRWQTLTDEVFFAQEEEVYYFEHRHDLGRAMKGLSLPSLFLLREHDEMLMATDRHFKRHPHREVMTALEGIGEDIAGRLRHLADPQAQEICRCWDRRHPAPRESLVRLVTRLSEGELADLRRGRNLAAVWDLPADRFQMTELLAAARMVSPKRLRVESTRAVLDAIRGQPRRSVPILDRLSAAAEQILHTSFNAEPYSQGYRLAQWLRQQDGIVASDGTVDPEGLLRTWNVALPQIDVPEQDLEAIACWGPLHGPAITVNGSGLRCNLPSGRRSILAHEICHLLVDRGAALPLAEVLDGRISDRIEKRARAFAAELLIPQEIIIQKLRTSPDIIESVAVLASDYGVSREMVAWQARNAESHDQLDPSTLSMLRQFVSQPEKF